jgi:hypothetical protein
VWNLDPRHTYDEHPVLTLKLGVTLATSKQLNRYYRLILSSSPNGAPSCHPPFVKWKGLMMHCRRLISSSTDGSPPRLSGPIKGRSTLAICPKKISPDLTSPPHTPNRRAPSFSCHSYCPWLLGYLHHHCLVWLENLHVAMPTKHNYTSFGVRPRDHYMLLQRSTLGRTSDFAWVGIGLNPLQSIKLSW